MTDPSELIARLGNGFFYTQFGEASDVPDQAADMLRAVAAERDAALKQVRETCLQFLMDQGQQIDAALAAKPTAPTCSPSASAGSTTVR